MDPSSAEMFFRQRPKTALEKAPKASFCKSFPRLGPIRVIGQLWYVVLPSLTIEGSGA